MFPSDVAGEMLHVSLDHTVGQRCSHETHVGHINQAHFLFGGHDDVAKVQRAKVNARRVQLAHQGDKFW
ncbi:hypothetical protein D3C77_656750 [compost metagenome]